MFDEESGFMVSFTKRQVPFGWFIVSVALNLGLILGCLIYIANSGGLRRILMKFNLATMPPMRAEFQLKDEERFRLLPNTSAEVVFAGDSLIAGAPWSELYTEIHNRGIGGDRTDDLLRRLDEILESQPRKIIILIGCNDLSAGVPANQILRNYRAILTKIQKDSPKTKVYVSALLPVNSSFTDLVLYSNKDVQAVNELLESLVREFPPDQFFDLKDQLVDNKGELKQEYTNDGYHININAYLAIQGTIRALLDQP